MPDFGFDDDLEPLPEEDPLGGPGALRSAEADLFDPEALEDPLDDEREPEPPPAGPAIRLTPGERMLRRLGHRAFSRPRVAVSGRLFARYRVTDPWDPDPKAPEDPIALGPVSLMLGERRSPAPHLAPPTAKEKARKPGSDAGFRPKIPDAAPAAPRAPEPAPSPTPAPTPAPTATPAERPGGPSAIARAFGAKDERQPLRKPLPVRPDRAPSAPAAPPEPPAERGNAGRFRMQATRVSDAPRIRDLPPEPSAAPPEAEASPEPAAPPAAPAAAPPPRPPMPPMGDSLDDLFGMAAMAGRMSLGSRKKKELPPPEEG